MRISGFVSPRYLNYDWNVSFSVSSSKTKGDMIPVIVDIDSEAYNCAKFTNTNPTYSEMRLIKSEAEMELVNIKKLLKEACDLLIMSCYDEGYDAFDSQKLLDKPEIKKIMEKR